MCGFFGILHSDGSPVSLSLVHESTERLRHRGPDDEGYLCFQTRTKHILSCAGRDTDKRLSLPLLDEATAVRFDCVLGFRRLSIIDVSPNGHQPMVSHDGRYWVVFNGEIYNYLELRRELIGLGYAFRTQSDTEVLLTAYVHWGPQALRRFIGMFAFAILDTEARRIFLGRDPFGIKPLYYVLKDRVFAFASELAALLDVPGVRRAVNPERLYLYLTSGLTDHGADTMFAEINQLPAAHYMEIRVDKLNRPQPVRYWHTDMNTRTNLSPAEAGDRLRELFLASTRLHLRSDVAVGAALSGGMDSSSIVNTIRHVQGQNVELSTFSYIAGMPTIDEEAWVDIAGRAAGAVIHKVTANADELLADVEHLISVHGEPFGSTSIYAQYRVFKSAREAGIKVLLDGQGADELLGGYRGHLSARLASLLFHRRWHAGIRLVWQASHWKNRARIFWFEARPYLLPPSMGTLMLRLIGGTGTPAWLNTDWVAKHGPFANPHACQGGSQALRKTLIQNLTTTTLPMLLRYEDRNSMSQSIESRVPFLTTDLADLLLTLPDEFIIDGDGLSKAVMRRAMQGIVPDPILFRKDKIGFETPERQWMTSLRPWIDDTLRSHTAAGIPAINSTIMRQDWQAMMNGTKPYDTAVWRWVNLIRWTDVFKVAMA